MGCENRAATHAVELVQRAQREPYQFDFFQLLRWLENIYRERPRIAEAERPGDDLVRLGQIPSLAFAPSTVASCEPGGGGQPARVAVHFFGLFGPQGPLPVHLTEYARDRWRNDRDPTLVRFADIFHHRLLALFYRAWANAQPTVQYDRAESDRFAVYVGSLLGIGMPALFDRDALPDNAKRYFAGTLACQTRHPDGLRGMLAAYFQLPVAIEEFVGAWISLPKDCHCRLGESLRTGTLGQLTLLGERAWDCAQTFRIVLGPVGLPQFLRLLPGGDSLRCLTALVRNYAGDELAWELVLILKKEEVPPTRLGDCGQLGWTTWLACESRGRDADDMLLRPMTAGETMNHE